ncbi:nucleotidyltransferase family protein [Peribacillus sp. SCS-37]|uniref:nucleotidyltransferase domain-containing protein n=1 Tax=Paraperibacillus esterisolvens TaxID=3115296 RepID=UPI0039064C8A
MNLLEILFDPKASLPQKGLDYERMLADIEASGVGPQTYYLLRKSKKLKQAPEYFEEKLKQRFHEALLQNLFIRNQGGSILNRFEQEGIDVIPLKGTFFAERYMGHLGARLTSDIDLLIRPEDVQRAGDVLRELDFQKCENDIQGHFHTSFYKDMNQSVSLNVELHWDILIEETASFDIREFWDGAAAYEGHKHIKELSLYHTFYMICLHGWRHNLDSLKYYIDIIVLILQLPDSFQYSRLMKDARRHKTFRRMQRTISLVYGALPMLDERVEFLYKKPSRFRKNLIAKGRKTTLADYFDFIEYQFLSFDTARHSLKELKSWMNAPAER